MTTDGNRLSSHLGGDVISLIMDRLLTPARTDSLSSFSFSFFLCYFFSAAAGLLRDNYLANLALFLSGLVHLLPTSRPHSLREHFPRAFHWPVCFPTAFPTGSPSSPTRHWTDLATAKHTSQRGQQNKTRLEMADFWSFIWSFFFDALALQEGRKGEATTSLASNTNFASWLTSHEARISLRS